MSYNHRVDQTDRELPALQACGCPVADGGSDIGGVRGLDGPQSRQGNAESPYTELEAPGATEASPKRSQCRQSFPSVSELVESWPSTFFLVGFFGRTNSNPPRFGSRRAGTTGHRFVQPISLVRFAGSLSRLKLKSPRSCQNRIQLALDLSVDLPCCPPLLSVSRSGFKMTQVNNNLVMEFTESL